MRDLLTAIKAQLQGDQTLSFVRSSDIYITEDENVIPSAIRYPAIAIKDGPVVNMPGTNLEYSQQADVYCIGYVSIKRPEDSIMADRGVLALMELVITSLIQNALSISGVSSVFPPAEGESELFGDESEMLQKKKIVMRYTRQKSLPRRS